MIIVFKSEFEGNPALAQGVENFCEQITQIGQACAYIPKIGKAQELVSLLQQHKIRFGMHQSQSYMGKGVDQM